MESWARSWARSSGPSLFGFIVNGFDIPGRHATDIATALEAIPGALIGIGLIYAEGVRREHAGHPGAVRF